MNPTACIQLAAASVLTVASIASDSSTAVSMPSDILQGGALVTLSWTVYHMLTRTIPGHLEALRRQAESHELAQAEQRKDFLKALRSCAFCNVKDS